MTKKQFKKAIARVNEDLTKLYDQLMREGKIFSHDLLRIMCLTDSCAHEDLREIEKLKEEVKDLKERYMFVSSKLGECAMKYAEAVKSDAVLLEKFKSQMENKSV